MKKQIEEWFEQRLPDGRRQNRRPPRALWMQLDPDQRQQVYERLRLDSDAIVNQAEEPDVPGETTHGATAGAIAPNIEPPPGSAEYQVAQSSIPPEEGANPSAVPASAAAVAGAAAPTGGRIGQLIGRIAGAAAPYAGAIGTVAASALPLILIPTNTQSGTVELDDGLRARIRPGQRSVTLERRVNGGLFGTGIGAKWEDLPVEAEIAWGPQGRAIKINPEQLKETLGEEQANRVLAAAGATPPSEPQVIPPPVAYEMRIGVSVDGAKTWKHREASEEEVKKYCANYPKYYRIALEAAELARASGVPNGLTYGNLVDKATAAEIAKIRERLKAEGIREVLPRVALQAGIPLSYLPKGSSQIDILEIHDRKVICVYDVKTGGAKFPDQTKERYGGEAVQYANETYKAAIEAGYTHIYVIPIHVP